MHAGAVQQFVNSPGFGVGRRLTPTPELFEAQEKLHGDSPDAIPQPSHPYYSSEPASGPVQVAGAEFAEVHDTNAVEFLDPFDFGYIRDRQHVAGFQSHHFRRPAQEPRLWKVQRLELVGLLKYDEPVVYLSENLPRMDELRDAPTRPLDAFEQEALNALRRGEDLMVQDGSERMRVLGSLRAVDQCIRCHQVERGELLGAFSYKLVRDAAKK
jgi:hypothetical protein